MKERRKELMMNSRAIHTRIGFVILLVLCSIWEQSVGVRKERDGNSFDFECWGFGIAYIRLFLFFVQARCE